MTTYTTSTAAFQGYLNSITQGGVQDQMTQAQVAANFLKLEYAKQDGWADDKTGKTASIVLNMLEFAATSEKRETREYATSRIINTKLDPETEITGTARSSRKNVSSSTLTDNNIIYRTKLDMAANLPAYEQTFFKTLAKPILVETKVRKIPQAELVTMDVQTVYNTMAHEMNSLNVQYARELDRALLAAITASYTGVNESGISTATSYSVSALSSSLRIANSFQKFAFWDAAYEANLVSNHLGLTLDGLMRLKSSVANFEWRGIKPFVIAPNSYIAHLFRDPAIRTEFGLREIANEIFKGKMYVPDSDGHIRFMSSSLPFELVGFDSQYDDLFFGNDGTNDYCKAIMLSPFTFFTGEFQDPVMKAKGELMIENLKSSTTESMTDLYIQKRKGIDIGLSNNFLTKTFKMGVPA